MYDPDTRRSGRASPLSPRLCRAHRSIEAVLSSRRRSFGFPVAFSRSSAFLPLLFPFVRSDPLTRLHLFLLVSVRLLRNFPAESNLPESKSLFRFAIFPTNRTNDTERHSVFALRTEGRLVDA